MSAPSNKVTLQSLGMVNYCNNFVQNMLSLCTPMNNILEKDTKWFRTPLCKDAFEKIKNLLKSNLMLAHYNPQLPIIVSVDPNDYGVSTRSYQKFPDGTQKPICHVSRRLIKAEKKPAIQKNKDWH